MSDPNQVPQPNSDANALHQPLIDNQNRHQGEPQHPNAPVAAAPNMPPYGQPQEAQFGGQPGLNANGQPQQNANPYQMFVPPGYGGVQPQQQPQLQMGNQQQINVAGQGAPPPPGSRQQRAQNAAGQRRSNFWFLSIDNIDKELQTNIIPYFKLYKAYVNQYHKPPKIGQSFPPDLEPAKFESIDNEEDPKKLMKDLTDIPLPLVHCSPRKALIMVMCNLFMNPLGTLLGLKFEEVCWYEEEFGFNFMVVIISVMQMIFFLITFHIGYGGTYFTSIVNFPSVVFGLFITLRIYYINIRRIELEQKMAASEQNPLNQYQQVEQRLVAEQQNQLGENQQQQQ